MNKTTKSKEKEVYEPATIKIIYISSTDPITTSSAFHGDDDPFKNS